MKTFVRKTASFVLTLALMLSLFAGLAIVPKTEVNAASYPTGYPNNYKNTGAGATDIVAVARTQIGYRENDYGTKYGYWYYPSFVAEPWCAMFVSWCANQANIPTTTITKYAACSQGMNWFKAQGRWHDSKYFGGDYTPKKGDIVFYSDEASQTNLSHTGIVAGLNGNYLDVIEGNATNESVCEYTTNSARSLSSGYVVGYGSPNYSVKIENEPKKYEVWQVSADALNMRKDASISAGKVTELPFGTSLNVTQFQIADNYLWGYTKYSKKTGWVALDYCDYIYGNIDGTYYQLKPKLNFTKAELYLGDTKRIGGTNILGAKFISTDTEIAKVSSKGLITALKAGTVKIKVKTALYTAVCSVTVKNPELSAVEASACAGDSYTLTVNHAKEAVTWKSADKEIAKVSSKGKVTAVKKGSVKITATVSGVDLDCNFTVTKYPHTYENFKTARTTYLKNDYSEMKSLVKLPAGTPLKITEVYYSDTYSFGKTTYDKKTGWVILNKCEYLNGVIDGKKYLVRPYLTEKSSELYVNETGALDVIDAAEPVVFATNDKSIARINSKGVFRAMSEGETTLTATIGKTVLEYKIVVKNPTLFPTAASLLKDESLELVVTGATGEVVFKSSDKTVASVNSKGAVKAKGFGKAKITATTSNITLTCEVNVYDPILSAEAKTVRVGQTKTLRVKQCSDSKIIWRSSDSKKVKVNSNGEITGVAVGKATVTATVDGVTLICAVKIAKALT